MRLMAKNKKRWVAFSAAAIMALGLTLPSTIRAGAYTLDNAATFVGEARTPDYETGIPHGRGNGGPQL